MSEKLRIKWEVEDGYAGPSRPHNTVIDRDELAEYDTWEEAKEYIWSEVQSDFEESISPVCDPTDLQGEWKNFKERARRVILSRPQWRH